MNNKMLNCHSGTEPSYGKRIFLITWEKSQHACLKPLFPLKDKNSTQDPLEKNHEDILDPETQGYGELRGDLDFWDILRYPWYIPYVSMAFSKNCLRSWPGKKWSTLGIPTHAARTHLPCT